MNNIHKISVVLLFVALATAATRSENVADVKSPGGTLGLVVENDGGTLYYTLSRGSKNVVAKSPVGLVTSSIDFSTGVTIKSATTQEIDDKFSLPASSQSTVSDRCKEITVNIEKNSKSGAVVFRLYDEGMAWRYTMEGSGTVTVTGDAGTVKFSSANTYLSLPLSRGTRASFRESNADMLECMGTAALPIVAVSGDIYTIIGETAPVKDFCGSRLNVPAKETYQFTPIQNVTVALPLTTPWRTVLTGKAADIVSSHIAECLAEPTALTNISWIKPGRAVNAYSGQDHTASYLDGNKVNSYIDWAATQGWEYITLDKWWNLTTSQLKQVVTYAANKNVGIFVWKSRANLPATEGGIRAELQTIKQAGAKGVKVEFWENETQDMINQRNLLMQIAAEQQLMVLLSNTVNTAGLQRTWPHLMGTESGLTNSSYVFTPDMVGARHNINSAIFSTTGGAIDYYPVDFAEYNGKLLQSTTHAHQLALAVAFQSGVQHIADAPDNLRYSIAKNILKALPATWDETLWLEAEYDETATVVRRSGNDFYLALLTAEAGEKEVPLNFLPEGKKVNVYIYRDGSCPTDINFEYKTGLTSASTLTLKHAAKGGALVLLTSDENIAKPYYRRYEAEALSNTIPFGVSVIEDTDGLCSGNAYVAGGGNGKAILFNNISVPQPGNYAINVYYMSEETSTGSLRLNGQLSSIRGLNFINSGGTTGRNLACVTATIKFDQTDSNVLELSSSGYLPSIDRITVTDNEATVYTDKVESIAGEDEAFFRAYIEGKKVIVETAADGIYALYNTQGICLSKGTVSAGVNTIAIDADGVVILTVSNEKNTRTRKLIL